MSSRSEAARYAYFDSNFLGLSVPLVLTVGIIVADVLEGPYPAYVGFLCAPPLLAATFASPLWTALVGVVVSASTMLFGYFQHGVGSHEYAAYDTAQQVRVAVITATCVLAVAVSYFRRRRAHRWQGLTSVADAAQRAILAPLPARVGHLKCAATCVSATAQALIGGDLFEVLDTKYGVRVLIGDVRGKGLDALRMSGVVLGSFREHAWTAADLPSLALHLDGAVARAAESEDFVTGCLMQFHSDGQVTLVTLGHPSPYLVTCGVAGATQLAVDSDPPLGLLVTPPTAFATRIEPGQRVVLVTDGLTEARRPRRWFDRSSGFIDAERVLGEGLSSGSIEAGISAVIRSTRKWCRGRLSDDLAVLVLEMQPDGSPEPDGRILGTLGRARRPDSRGLSHETLKDPPIHAD